MSPCPDGQKQEQQREHDNGTECHCSCLLFVLVVSAYPGRAVCVHQLSRNSGLISRKKAPAVSAVGADVSPFHHGAPQNLRFAWHHIGLKWAGRACPFHIFACGKTLGHATWREGRSILRQHTGEIHRLAVVPKAAPANRTPGPRRRTRGPPHSRSPAGPRCRPGSPPGGEDPPPACSFMAFSTAPHRALIWVLELPVAMTK